MELLAAKSLTAKVVVPRRHCLKAIKVCDVRKPCKYAPCRTASTFDEHEPSYPPVKKPASCESVSEWKRSQVVTITHQSIGSRKTGSSASILDPSTNTGAAKEERRRSKDQPRLVSDSRKTHSVVLPGGVDGSVCGRHARVGRLEEELDGEEQMGSGSFCGAPPTAGAGAPVVAKGEAALERRSCCDRCLPLAQTSSVSTRQSQGAGKRFKRDISWRCQTLGSLKSQEGSLPSRGPREEAKGRGGRGRVRGEGEVECSVRRSCRAELLPLPPPRVAARSAARCSDSSQQPEVASRPAARLDRQWLSAEQADVSIASFPSPTLSPGSDGAQQV